MKRMKFLKYSTEGTFNASAAIAAAGVAGVGTRECDVEIFDFTGAFKRAKCEGLSMKRMKFLKYSTEGTINEILLYAQEVKTPKRREGFNGTVVYL